MTRRLAIILFALAILTIMVGTVLTCVQPASGATYYYSRDGNGDRSATSYANRGRYYGDSNVRLAVAAGDTVYFCGPFVSDATNAALRNFYLDGNGTAASPIVVRMDYDGDPGAFYNVNHLRSYATWSEPDPNNGYSRFSIWSSAYPVVAWPTDPNLREFLPARTSLSAEDANGVMFDKAGNGIFVKLSGGRDPNNGRVCFRLGPNVGHAIDITGRNYVKFLNCTFFGGLSVSTTGATFITLDTCEIAYNNITGVQLYKGMDDWTIKDCTIHDCANGIYASATGDVSANRVTVTGGRIWNMGAYAVLPYLYQFSKDAHAIGMQYTSGWRIEGVEMDHCSSAIEAFTHTPPLYAQQDNTFLNLTIHDTREANSITNRGGITIYSGRYVVQGCVFWNIGGTAISAATDANGVIEHCSFNRIGMDSGWWMGAAYKAKNTTVRYNVIANARFSGSVTDGDPNLQEINWNCYQGIGSDANFGTGTSGTTGTTLANWRAAGWDANSLTSVPGWSSADPNTLAGFSITHLSAVWLVAPVAPGVDRNSVPWGRSMGAFGFVPRVFGVKP